MLRVIGKRVLYLIPTLFGLSILLFLWVRSLPGGPAVAILGEKATPEAIERINELYGFDRPLIEQYFTWIASLFQGNFGASIMSIATAPGYGLARSIRGAAEALSGPQIETA